MTFCDKMFDLICRYVLTVGPYIVLIYILSNLDKCEFFPNCIMEILRL